jgi:TonB family protein
MATQGVSGTVVLHFVVDTQGLAELKSLVVAKASHNGFIRSARRAVASCSYLPAERDGRPVRQRVQQHVVFGEPGRDAGSSMDRFIQRNVDPAWMRK